MADVLSQSQIDDILKSLGSSSDNPKAPDISKLTASEKKSKPYDFRMPKKFTKERIKILNRIYEIYSRLLSSYLTGQLRTYCKVNVLSIEEQRYYEFNNALPEYVFMSVMDFGIDSPDIDDTSYIVQISNPIAFAMLDRLMGGDGAYDDTIRDFTEIEITLLKVIAKKLGAVEKESWANYIDINPSSFEIETNSRVVQTIPPDEAIILVLFEIEIKNITSTMSICIPAINLEQIMMKIGEKNNRSNKKNDAAKEDGRKNTIMDGLKDTELPITALLCESQIELADVLRLQPNDIIPLNIGIDQKVVLKVGETKWFDGKIGIKNNKKAVKIDEALKN